MKLRARPDSSKAMASTDPAHSGILRLNSLNQRRRVLSPAPEGASESFPPSKTWRRTASISEAT
ncbi:MAG: hypothetical protein Q7J73_08060 [Dehalococcoidales bacterium]|nr:hypothetical protein [Dehalococcoidales bacterium]